MKLFHKPTTTILSNDSLEDQTTERRPWWMLLAGGFAVAASAAGLWVGYVTIVVPAMHWPTIIDAKLPDLSLPHVPIIFPSSGGPGQSDNGGPDVGNGSGSTAGMTASIQPTHDGPVAGGPTTNTVFKSQCLNRGGPHIVVEGPQTAEYHVIAAPNTVFDATTATWNGRVPNGGHEFWPITIASTGPVCWYGGNYQGAWDDTDPNITWENPYHHSGGITVRSPNMLIESLRIDNQGDGVNVDTEGANFDIRGIHLSNIHDDCIQNDDLNSGLVDDSFLESCYSGFSAAWYNLPSGTGINNTWEIDNTLEHSSCSVPYYPKANSCYGLWLKGWYETNVGPKLVLNNDIFRFDQKSGQLAISSSATYTIPTNARLTSCSNNIVVWTGSGNFPYPLPSCFTVTKDVSVWDNAVAKWKADHPADAN